MPRHRVSPPGEPATGSGGASGIPPATRNDTGLAEYWIIRLPRMMAVLAALPNEIAAELQTTKNADVRYRY
jgi:hypothetical protein